MQRRHLLALGASTAAVLAVAGASVAWMKPPREQGRLAPPARELMAAVARAVLDDALPADPALLDAHLLRLEATIAGLSPALQAEVDQLLALLASAPGRLALTGLSTPWPQASRGEVQAMLQSLRSSSLQLRQQVFHALRDLTNGAFFADPGTWAALGYPGPRAI